MRHDTELESLALRLIDCANAPALCDQPDLQNDLRIAAAVVREHVAILRTAGNGATGRELAQLLCPGGLVG